MVRKRSPFSGEWARNLVSDDKDKASWELRRKNVGVYAIQGRRPHMEDRFNVLADSENRGTTVLGVFDGHGGEV
jgi:protein phosphatase 1L